MQLVKGITGISRSRIGRVLLRLRWAALALFIVALARPQLGRGNSPLRASGIDIVVALDLSGSMASEDFELRGSRVDRLTIAKDVLRKFVEGESTTASAWSPLPAGYMASPLTLDHDFLLENIERLELAIRSRTGRLSAPP